MLEFERSILSTALSGDRAPMPSLREKASNLRVVTRSRSLGAYSVKFDAPQRSGNTPFRGPNGDWICLSISDTRVLLEENEQWIKVTVMVLFGDIQWMMLEGNFDFNRDFHVSDVFWCTRVSGTNPPEFVRTTERDFEFGFDWNPVRFGD